MNPSIDLRLATMERAMTAVILPALDPSQGLAREQAGLVIGHLSVLRSQMNHAERYEALEYDAALAFGRAIVNELRDDLGCDVRNSLEAVLGMGLADTTLSRRDRTESIRSLIEAVLREVGHTGADDVGRRLRTVTLTHERLAANRSRTWFAGMGWEDADSGLPPISDMFADTSDARSGGQR